ncbi:putative Calcium/calmodulin-dependent protein kinase II (putative) [Rhodotorula toruloides]|uniref:BY PROTMAP: gi/472586733/gb/EMS24252.1/ calcium calmodulin-dependent protein kinase [Rhodosporidium toruloides NP11] gi/647398146/emb/CDR41773.1/ RHTO0S06e06018g1_1 [Rhodosporidium toruloides] n=1 Tax=Rhodotorula toruloides TaxID=5286 RepID=A0A0K3CC31_RHOTO|nr:putative Calcium/calmodulin-dependent protein kinase II (putative) [Rhodotorula toruloides]PRQ76210.1 Protein kinase-like domain-containing protein [Rhodotorula toruloides]
MHLFDYISGQPQTHHRKRHYTIRETLGVGGFAEVKRATALDTGREVAIKIIPKTRIRDMTQQIFRQNTLLTLKHPHIIETIEWFESKGHIYIVFELAAGGELFEHLIESPNYRFSEAEAREVMYALVDGVAYLHSRNIVHRDLKPENVLYRTPPGSHPEIGHDDCVISDFGLAAYVDPKGGRLHTVAGSAGYTAPEVYPEEGVVDGRGQGRGYGLKVDVWSLGIIAFCCLGGRFPYKETEPAKLADEARRTKLYFPRSWENVSETAKDFIRRLLTVDEDERPTAAEALEHPWLRVALSRPPSPSGHPAAAPAQQQPDYHPDDHHLGPTLSRTDTLTDHAPIIEKRGTFSSDTGDRAVV